MVEKELGERNFGFYSLKSRLKRDGGESNVFSGHLSRLPPEFVVAGDVKLSTGGSLTS